MKYICFFAVVFILLGMIFSAEPATHKTQKEISYWLLLHRKSNLEFLFYGIPGENSNSWLIKIFKVKTGIPGKRPTPLPQLLGRKYWLITEKNESKEDPETSPYFLTLDIPVSEDEPYGPLKYPECNNDCNWSIPGNFGLHGVNGNLSKLSDGDMGSSGCIRHRDLDITYLYIILDPVKEEVRYYVEDI